MISKPNEIRPAPATLSEKQIVYLLEFLAFATGTDLPALKRAGLKVTSTGIGLGGQTEPINLQDLFGALTLQSEINVPLDKHKRVTSRELDLRFAEVDDQVNLFRKLLPTSIVNDKAPELMLTHDVDRIHFKDAHFAGSSVAGALRNPLALSKFGRLFEKDSKILARFESICNLESGLGAGSTFFMMCEPYRLRRYNAHYSFHYGLYPRIAHLLQEEGAEIGLHGSYYSYENADYEKEKKRLEDICGREVISNRNHYLRFDRTFTPRGLVKSGIKLDSTLGFSDCNQFRNGSSHPFKYYDLAKDMVLSLVEVPLIYMDTIAFVNNETKTKILTDLENILGRVKQQRGTVALLFHYDILTENETWFSIYREVMSMAKVEGFAFVKPRELIKRYGL